MDKRNSVLQSAASAVAMNKLASTIKQADGFEFIGDVPMPGGHGFSNHKLEADYEMKHPEMKMFHPGIYGGALAGGLAASIAHGNAVAHHAAPAATFMEKVIHHPGFGGAVLGAAAGMGLEAIHRYHFLQDAKRKMEAGVNPLDPRYQV